MSELTEGYKLSGQRLVMYSDLNAAGRLFGGRLMAWLDESLAMSAMQMMGTNTIVTKKFGELVFDAPGLLGDFVEIWCRPAREGRTSLTLECRALVHQLEPPALKQICQATVVYVAIDKDGQPRPWREA